MKKFRAVSVEQIQRLDRIAIEEIGIPSLVLMENAGRSVADFVSQQFKISKGKFVCIFCGLGNNAGDGLVVARHLLHSAIKTKVFLLGSAKSLKADAAVNYQILKNLGCPVEEIQSIDQTILRDIRRADMVIDAIFGVGLSRSIENPFKSVIEILNQEAKRIIAVDIPSGLNATTGEIYGTCIRASATITFTLPKKGFFKKAGPRHVGRNVVAEIGIPKKLFTRIF